MDSLILLGVLGVGIVLIYLMLNPKRPRDAPPTVQFSVPVLGAFLEFAKSPMDLMKNSMQRYGPAFTVNMFGSHLTFLIGPDVAEAFYRANDEVLSQPEVYGFMKAVFGADVVYDATPPRRRQQMQNMSKGLRKERLQSYVPKIVRETKDYIKDWGDDGVIDIFNALSELTILTASRCLHGDDVRETMFKDVSRLYADMDQGITPLTYFFPTAPIESHRKRDAARAEMVSLFSKVIAARRANPEKSKENTDILQVFIDMQYKDGTHNTDDQIVGMLIALLFAGQHTSSITSTWTTLFLVHNPEILERVVAEVDSVVKPGEPLTFEHVQKMDLLHNCVKEALRLQPPLIMLMRRAKQDVVVKSDDGKTFTVPKGDTVVSSPALQHRLGRVYKNPDKFDPDRFNEERAEDKKWPFAYLGFGGGMHACMGQNFGYMQVKTIVATLVRRYRLEAVDPMPETNYKAMVVGPTGTPRIRYQRRQQNCD